LIVWLNEHKIVRPAHTTLQELISEALSAERRRLGDLLGVLDGAGQGGAGSTPGARRHLSELAVLQAGRQGFRLAANGARSGRSAPSWRRCTESPRR
jgi:hypothetical protein